MRISILGGTGLVGRETIDLVGRAWPEAELILFASRDQSLDYAGKRFEVQAAERLEHDAAPRGDLAFVALDDEHSRRFVPRLLALGYHVIDKSNTYRSDPQVVLGVAGVNDDLITRDVQLVANPNCTTIPLTLALRPLERRYGLADVTVSTYQAVSGAGIGALDQFLTEQRSGYADADRLGQTFDASHYAGNTVPHNGGTDASGFSSEERKLHFETRKILRLPGLPISAQCCRVPVAVGHYENVWLSLEKAASLEQVAAVLSDSQSAPFVRFSNGATGEGLSALASVQQRDYALVGRLRADGRDASGKRLCLTVVGDNLRLGAATNAVRLATRWFPARDPELNTPTH
jgi:aspartate-semialdehyde dehydrogenase